MKFTYQYRTSDNSIRYGNVYASNRDAAYKILRKEGIRPSRVDIAPGLFNRIFGLGKRWIAIWVLAIAFASVLVAYLQLSKQIDNPEVQFEARSQIYGDPAILDVALENNWADIFTNVSVRFLAAYAIPGREVRWSENVSLSELSESILEPETISPDDYAEIAKIKKIVNGMKLEARNYLLEGGTIDLYVSRVIARQREERELLSRIEEELHNEDDPAIWEERNGLLRQMGLPMIPRKDESHIDFGKDEIDVGSAKFKDQ